MPQKSQAKNQTTNGRKYLEYSEMSKEDLVRLLKRVHARIKRISTSLKTLEGEIEELRQLLLYGSVQASSSSNSSPSPGHTKSRAYKGRTGGYRRTGKKQAGVEEEPIEEVMEEEEEEKPVEKKPGEAKAESKPEKGGS